MIEKTPSIDDVQPGGPTRAEWGNAIRDAAAAHYPGGSFVGSSRGGYHRPPLIAAAAAAAGGPEIVGFCCGAFSAGSSTSATVTWIAAGATVAVGDTITISDPCGQYNNTSGSGCGTAVKVSDAETGTGTGGAGSWYIIDLTCPTVVANCGDTGTGSGS